MRHHGDTVRASRLRPHPLLLALTALLVSCGQRDLVVAADPDSVDTTGTPDVTQTGADELTTDGGDSGTDMPGVVPGIVSAPTLGAPVEVAMCGARACSCDDGEDNDNDGYVDGLDPECTGPFDDDEATFGTAVVGERNATCTDCFFDANIHPEDDGCLYAPSCATSPNKLEGLESCSGDCSPSAACYATCKSRTPSGCDCFGCCEVYDHGKKPQYIWLNENCSLDNIQDRKACPRCEVNSACYNACTDCELCIGKRPDELPETCQVDGGVSEYECDDGARCSDKEPCDSSYFYCQQGCCIPRLF